MSKRTFIILFALAGFGCAQPALTAERSDDFYQTRLMVSSGSAETSADETKQTLAAMQKLQSQIQQVSSEVRTVNRQLEARESELKRQ